MTPKRKDVTDAELSILEALWDEGPSTIRRLTEILYPRGDESDYATVKKLLARIEAKGFVRRDRGQLAHVFEPTLTRDDLIGQRLSAVADHLCGGSRTPILLHLLRNEKLSEAELDELRQFVEREKKRSARRGRGKTK